MDEKEILIIHPQDNTTTFLNRIKNHLIYSSIGQNVSHFNIHPYDESHQQCLRRVLDHSENGLIIFLGHGRSDRLYGAKGSLYNHREFVSDDAIKETPDKYYHKENFIDESNVSVFKGKKVFCLACNSNDRIGKLAGDLGVSAFMGFGDIPTSIAEFKLKGHDVSERFVAIMKAELNYVIKNALLYAIQKKLSFSELKSLIDFLCSQRIAEGIINAKGHKQRHLLGDFIYLLKKEIVIFGNASLKLI